MIQAKSNYWQPDVIWTKNRLCFLLQSKPKKIKTSYIFETRPTYWLMVCFEHDATTRHGTNDHSFLKLDYISADSRSLDHQMAAYSSATITNPFDDGADRNDLFLPCLGDAIFATRPIPPTTLTFFWKISLRNFPQIVFVDAIMEWTIGGFKKMI